MLTGPAITIRVNRFGHYLINILMVEINSKLSEKDRHDLVLFVSINYVPEVQRL